MSRSRWLFSVLLLCIASTSPGWVKPVGGDKALDVARQWLSANPALGAANPKGQTWKATGIRPFAAPGGKTLAYIVDLAPNGFIIVAGDDEVEPIIFFSNNAKCTDLMDADDPLRELLLSDLPARLQDSSAKPKAYRDTVAAEWGTGVKDGFDPSTISIVTDSMVTTQWNQDGTKRTPFTDLPTYNKYTPGHRVAGCVAVATGQVIKWHMWPPAASGSGEPELDETNIPSSFNSRFNYELMPDKLDNNSTDNQIDQVATLLWDVGIMLDMEYESDGSSSYTDDVPDVLKDTFGYASAEYQTAFWSDHRTELQSDLIEGYPIILSIRTSLLGDGHCIVGDGFGWLYHPDGSATDVYHLNMGWNGDNDGWYAIPGFTTGSYTWNTFQGFVYHIYPPEVCKVDLMNSRAGTPDAVVGNNIYNETGAGQLTTDIISPAAPAVFKVIVQNEGTFPNEITLHGPAGDGSYQVAYFNDATGANITSGITSTGWNTPLIRPGQTFTIRVAVTDFAIPQGESRDVLIHASVLDSPIDSALLRVERRPARPNVLIRPLGGTYGESSTAQIVATDNSAVYQVLLRNDGPTADDFLVRGWHNETSPDPFYTHLVAFGVGAERNWTWACYDESGADITDAVFYDMWHTGILAPGGTRELLIELYPNDQVASGGSARAFIRMHSIAFDPPQDTISGWAIKTHYEPSLGIRIQGVGAYNDTRIEDTLQYLQPGHFDLRLRNDGAVTDNFTLSSPAPGGGWFTQFTEPLPMGSNDITAAVHAGTYTSAVLPPGESQIIRMMVSVNGSVPAGAVRDIPVEMASVGDVTAWDQVSAHLGVGVVGPNLQTAVGGGAYSHDPASGIIPSDQALIFRVRVCNDGPLPDTFTLHVTEAPTSGWYIACYNALTGGSDISSSIHAGTYTVGPLAPGGEWEFRVEALPYGDVPSDGRCTVTITAASQSSPTNTDTVTDIAIKSRYKPVLLLKAVDEIAYQDTEVTQPASPTTPAVFNLQVRNAGFANDDFTLLAGWTSANPGWTAHYFDAYTGGTDITSDITIGKWTTGTLGPGAWRDLRIEITPGVGVPAGAVGHATITATSAKVVGLATSIIATASKVSCRPTALIRGAGYAVYGETTPGLTVNGGQTAVYDVLVRNDGTASDTFTLHAETATPSSSLEQWPVVWRSVETGGNVTAAMLAGTLSIGPMAPGATYRFRAEVTPDSTVSSGRICQISLRATSQGDPDWFSDVLSITTKAACQANVLVLNGETYGNTPPSLYATSNVPAVCYLQVRNDGNATDSFDILCYHLGDHRSDWIVQYFDAGTGGNDVTTPVENGIWRVGPLEPGASRFFRVELREDGVQALGDFIDLTARATSIGDIATTDEIITRVTKQSGQPEIRIRPAGEETYSDVGASRSVAPATAAVYQVKVRNTGLATDTFWLTVSGISSGDPTGWALTYHDALIGGGDVTSIINSGVYQIGPLAPDEEKLLRVEVTPSADVPADGTLALTMTATQVGSSTNTDHVIATTTRARLPIAGVILVATPPSPQLANRLITLTATSVEGINVEYRFFKTFGGVTTTIQPYTLGANSLKLTLTELGQYQFIVWAREQGSAAKVYASVVYKVNPPLSAVTLKATPTWPQPPGTEVTVKATQVNGGQIEYRFYQANPGGPLTQVQAYGAASAYVFTPSVQGIYQITVYAREVGSTVTKQAYTTITYNCATPITSVDLAADTPSPGTVNTPITLTATAHGGLKVQYRFFVQPPGGVYTTIQNYAVGANTLQYTPIAPGKYYFMVYVRETYSTKPGKDAYKVLAYTVR